MAQTSELVPTSNFGKFKVYKASQMPRSGALILLYGAGGVGKTTLTASAQGRKVYLDYDRRTNVLAHRDDVDIIPLNTYQDSIDFFKGDPAQNWDVIVLDNASELAQIQLVHAEKTIQSKEPRQHYAAVQVDMVALFKSCRDYAARTGICIIWNAWEDKVQVLMNGVESERTAPAFAPQLAKNLLGLAQFVGYLSKEGSERTLVFESDKLPVKWGVAPNDVAAKIPRVIKNPNFAPILNTLIGGEPYKS